LCFFVVCLRGVGRFVPAAPCALFCFSLPWHVLCFGLEV
ncbi:hypothetical protein A2U01_0081311, partial [Trifolium medium]|nr:hypothetical protein [Trifolium medium]